MLPLHLSFSQAGRCRRLLSFLFVLGLALPVSLPAADYYLFQPGHGLTGQSAGVDFETTLAAAVDINTNMHATAPNKYRVRIRFIEQVYDWPDIETSKDTYDISKILDDLRACADRGLKLRVQICYKLVSYPDDYYLHTLDGANPNEATVKLVKGPYIPAEETPYDIRLDRWQVRERLKKLYTKVIDRIKNSVDEDGNPLWNAFYGIVLQETALAKPADPAFEWTPAIQDNWFANLKLVHAHLFEKLNNENVPEPKRRLFWQMINAPRTRTEDIVNSMKAGNGGKGWGALCGPDTFPKEPHIGNPETGALWTALSETYQLMRDARTKLPISLHVYSSNYRSPYRGGPLQEQAIYNTAVGDNDNNLNTPDGIANFLGCVPSPHVNSMQVHNVVWSLADNPNGTPAFTGWSRVKTWMKNTTQTVYGWVGGCNAAPPSVVTTAP